MLLRTAEGRVGAVSSSSSRMQCDICHRAARATELVSACACAKKREDRGRVHAECLRAQAVRAEHEDVDGAQRQRMLTCPHCQQRYAVHAHFEFNLRKLFTMRALEHLAEFCMLGSVLVCFIFSLSLLRFEKEHQTAAKVVGGVGVLVAIMVCFTLRTVFGRVKKSSATVSVVEDMV